MSRKNTKVGDVFSVQIEDGTKKYFQYIISDLTQLNSDVIRAFEKAYPATCDVNLEEVVKGEVAFYAHCVTKLGLKMGYWEFEGNCGDVGDTKKILFRDTNDYGWKPGEEVKVSNNWYVWRINDEDFTTVGRLRGENRNAEIGLVMSPPNIVHRILTGQYPIPYPAFE